MKNRGFSVVTALFNKTRGKNSATPVDAFFRSIETADDGYTSAMYVDITAIKLTDTIGP